MMQILREVRKLYKNLTLGIDMIFINSLLFFVIATRKIKFCEVKNISSKVKKLIMKCASAVIESYKHIGFNIVIVLGDNEFSYLKEYLNNKHNIKFNEASANEYIREIECMIRMIKERIRVIINSFP